MQRFSAKKGANIEIWIVVSVKGWLHCYRSPSLRKKREKERKSSLDFSSSFFLTDVRQKTAIWALNLDVVVVVVT